jgi:charged multivesicular body protein 6
MKPAPGIQEVSEMLGGRITNQDEEEVEDELAKLEREVNGPTPMPAVPVKPLPEPEAEVEPEPVPAPESQPERREAMLAS